MDTNEEPTQPQRLSALYQYHNAPEVAPTQGLEYDDTVYPVSDKFPVIHNDPYEPRYRGGGGSGGKGFDSDNRPPRIIFGMKIKTFFLVLLLVIAVVVGAAVGGAVGGKSMNSDTGVPIPDAGSGSSQQSSPTSSLAPTAITSTYAAPTPTYSPLNDCPNSNATLYNSALTKEDDVPSGADLKFIKYCGLGSPLGTASSYILSEAFVYTFDDCIEVCASLNFHKANGNCTVAAYAPTGSRPANCFVGSTPDVSAAALAADDGTNVAILDS